MKNLCRFVHPLVEGFASVRWKRGFCLMEAWFLPNETMFSAQRKWTGWGGLNITTLQHSNNKALPIHSPLG